MELYIYEATKSIDKVMKGNEIKMLAETDIFKLEKPKDYIITDNIISDEIKE
jgi:hypothetical protein